ncbi:YlbF family regulator [Alicyclobacillus dauci]|uniref:YlbF family regulator n=1 Tax=Alicyclobacillus dauci TaxID=1475485 RepID=A0ABY6YY95_9BACL|nr:YlbF family regulator [Alicyclobacillus dauci]WAH35552.1 YlbF family regulator [Alicyclobacillus dauci]
MERVSVDRVDLLVQADELADMILKTPEIQAFKQAEAAMEANGEAMNLLRRFRELREQVAEFQARQVPPMHYSYLLEETDQLMKKLEQIPEVKAFEDAQSKMNALLNAIASRLSAAVEQRLPDVNFK